MGAPETKSSFAILLESPLPVLDFRLSDKAPPPEIRKICMVIIYIYICMYIYIYTYDVYLYKVLVNPQVYRVCLN